MKALGIISGIIVTIIIFFAIFIYLDNQGVENKYRIGVLMTGENRIEKLEGMKSGLSHLGYQLDQFEFIIKDAEDDIAQMKKLAEKLIEDNLQLIVTTGGIETQFVQQEMKKSTKKIPVVFVGIAAPIELGLIEEYHSPGAMFTGVDNFHMNLSAKRLEMFVDLVPEMERVMVLYNSNIDISSMSLEIVKETAQKLNVDIFPHDFHADPSLELLENQISRNDGLMILPSYLIEANAEKIAKLSLRWQLPSMAIYDHEVEAGYLLSYGSSYFGQGYQAARHVSLILQGNDPAKLPVELPDSIEFFVNEDIRSELKVDLNEDILNLAERIRGDLH